MRVLISIIIDRILEWHNDFDRLVINQLTSVQVCIPACWSNGCSRNHGRAFNPACSVMEHPWVGVLYKWQSD